MSSRADMPGREPRADVPRPGRGGSGEDAQERYGPLVVARYEKDDGRKLLLYSLIQQEPLRSAAQDP